MEAVAKIGSPYLRRVMSPQSLFQPLDQPLALGIYPAYSSCRVQTLVSSP